MKIPWVQLIWCCEPGVQRWAGKSPLCAFVSVGEAALWRAGALRAPSLPATAAALNLTGLCCAPRQLDLPLSTNLPPSRLF